MDPMMDLDSDVFIDHFRGQEAASSYIHSLPADQRATTDITVMELYKGAANQQELTTIWRFLTHNWGQDGLGQAIIEALGRRAVAMS
jgi:predicted nucleic acid-binding protein